MLFSLFVSAVLSVASHAATNQYTIGSKLLVDGKTVASPRIVIDEGKEASILDVADGPDPSRLSMKFKATHFKGGDADSLLLTYVVSYSAKGRSMQTTSKVLAKLGQEFELPIGPDAVAPGVRLKVLATKE